MAQPNAPPPRRDGEGLRARLASTAGVTAMALRTLGLVAAVDRALLVALIVCQLLDGAGAVAIAWVGKRLIDAVVFASRAHGTHDARPALVFVAVEFGLVAARALVTNVNAYAQVILRSKLGLHVNQVILEKAVNVSYVHFEDPEFNNKLTQARREASARPLDLVNQLLALVRHGITLVGYTALLLSLGAWAVLALVVTALPPFLAEARHGRRMYALQKARTERNRRGFYLETVLSTEQTVKEVKLFALGRWLVDWYRSIHLGFHAEETALVRDRGRAAFLLGLVESAALYGTYAVIALRAVAGAITLGSMSLYIMVFRQGQASLQAALSAVARVYEDNLFMTNLFEYLSLPDDEPDTPIDPTLPLPASAPRVVFENVSFRYEGAARDALTAIDLDVAPGETIALVGRNGAGKTTLIKLLVGLYRPTGGRILIDGEDAATMNAAALRQKVGVIFQDFARFQFSAGDNVGLGWLPAREDTAAIDRAVNDAGAREVIERLPRGLATPLGRAFGGDDLSGGQWQRIALARAFMRKSRILVLDEPTAAMDAEAEHEIFQRFRDLKSNRTALLITHRFSTVRMADRIVVFEGGRMVEHGTHAALMAEAGRYAKMFNLQADGYRDAAPEPAKPRAADPDGA